MRSRLLPLEAPENDDSEGDRGEITDTPDCRQSRASQSSLSFRRARHFDKSEKRGDSVRAIERGSQQQVRSCDRQFAVIVSAARGEISYRQTFLPRCSRLHNPMEFKWR